jgi:hypothetical protein
MRSMIGALFSCTGLILIALSGIARLLVETSDLYLLSDTRMIPLLTFIGGMAAAIIGVCTIFRRPLFGMK